jgi:hypothetical protein
VIWPKTTIVSAFAIAALSLASGASAGGAGGVCARALGENPMHIAALAAPRRQAAFRVLVDISDILFA